MQDVSLLSANVHATEELFKMLCRYGIHITKAEEGQDKFCITQNNIEGKGLLINTSPDFQGCRFWEPSVQA
jgi:hypothetical protein